MNSSKNKSQSQRDYYPYLSLDEKVREYKRAIMFALDSAVHPDHLVRAEIKLKKLKQFWSADLGRVTKNDGQ